MDQQYFPKTGQRLTFSTPHTDDINNQENTAIPASAEDIARDEVGFTNPNLHRRIQDNVLHDGKKVYTILESYTTGDADTQYRINYPIINKDNIKFIFISGIPIQSVSVSIVLIEDSESHDVIGFKFDSGYAPQSGLSMEVTYETAPMPGDEVTYRDYGLAISGVYSYRTTKITLHTEEDEGDREHRVYENEIP